MIVLLKMVISSTWMSLPYIRVFILISMRHITLVRYLSHRSSLLTKHTSVWKERFKYANQVPCTEMLEMSSLNSLKGMDSQLFAPIVGMVSEIYSIVTLSNIESSISSVPHYGNNKAPGFMKVGHTFTIEPMIN